MGDDDQPPVFIIYSFEIIIAQIHHEPNPFRKSNCPVSVFDQRRCTWQKSGSMESAIDKYCSTLPMILRFYA